MGQGQVTLRTDKATSGGYLVKSSTPKAGKAKPLPSSHTKPNDPAKIKAEKSKVMTSKQWEASATDAAMDRKVAKQKGMTLRQYEGSPLDDKNDKKQLAAHNRTANTSKRGK